MRSSREMRFAAVEKNGRLAKNRSRDYAKEKRGRERVWDKLVESGGGNETKRAKNTSRPVLRFRPIYPSNRTYATYIRPPAYLSDSAYRLIERVVLRRGCRLLLVVPLD